MIIVNNAQMQAILEELLKAAAFLCEETASLVDDRAHRTVPDGQEGVRGRAEQLRLSGRSLSATLEALHQPSAR